MLLQVLLFFYGLIIMRIMKVENNRIFAIFVHFGFMLPFVVLGKLFGIALKEDCSHVHVGG